MKCLRRPARRRVGDQHQLFARTVFPQFFRHFPVKNPEFFAWIGNIAESPAGGAFAWDIAVRDPHFHGIRAVVKAFQDFRINEFLNFGV